MDKDVRFVVFEEKLAFWADSNVAFGKELISEHAVNMLDAFVILSNLAGTDVNAVA